MIEFRLQRLWVEPGRRETIAELEAGVQADFAIVVNDRVLFRDEYFNVLEFLLAIVQWLRTGVEKGEDFEFASMDCEDAGLVFVQRRPGGWRIGSIHEETADENSHPLDDIRDSVRCLIDRVLDGVPNKHRMRIQKALKDI